MRRGTIYTDTIVHLAPERFAAAVPYQVAIVELEDGQRITARIEGDRVVIGDPVQEAATRDGIVFFARPLS
jgi:uncharacterized OB-fold protein